MKNNIFINIKEYVAKRKSEIAEKVAKTFPMPQIAIIQVGDLEASNRYVRNKIKDCEEVGIRTLHTKLPESTSASTLKYCFANAPTLRPFSMSDSVKSETSAFSLGL